VLPAFDEPGGLSAGGIGNAPSVGPQEQAKVRNYTMIGVDMV